MLLVANATEATAPLRQCHGADSDARGQRQTDQTWRCVCQYYQYQKRLRDCVMDDENALDTTDIVSHKPTERDANHDGTRTDHVRMDHVADEINDSCRVRACKC